MEDWEEESPSDDDNDKTEIENELYSMFYYHSTSDGLPEDLSQKYRMETDSFGAIISLNDTSSNEQTSLKKSSGDSNLENEIISTDERYIDRGKGSLEIVSKTSNNNCDVYQSISKKLQVNKSFNGSSNNIPGQRPTSKFQSFRYYSEDNKSRRFVKNYHESDNSMYNLANSSNILYKNKNVIISTTVCQKNVNKNKNVTTSTPICQKNVNKNKNVTTSTPICQKNVNKNKNVTTSTPICQKNVNKNKNVTTSTPICQKNVNKNKNATTSTPVCQKNLNEVLINTKKNQPKKVIVNIKDNIDIIDLTHEFPKKQGKPKSRTKEEKRKQTVPVITISSESESDGESKEESIVSDSEEESILCDSEEESILSDSEEESILSDSEEESILSDSESDCDEQTFDSLMLNTSIPVDKNVCDISAVNLDYDWKNTSSPEGWSRSMRKFYNKPSKRLLNFDYLNIIEEMKEQGEGEWRICNADRIGVKSYRRVRCLRCHQEGHVKASCTKVFTCHMCGTPGHNFRQCPNNICLKCGSKCREIFPRSCAKCFHDEKMTCSHCGIAGHSSKLCTAAWQSISSREGSGNNTRNVTKYCCNCGKSGHYFEDCRQPHYSSYISGNEASTYKTGRFKGSSFKKKNHFKDKNFHSMDSQGIRFKTRARIRAKIRSRVLKSRKNVNHDSFNLHPSLKNAKNFRNSKRIQMLRKSNKNNKNKATLSHTM